jgi:hypothetical protein
MAKAATQWKEQNPDDNVFGNLTQESRKITTFDEFERTVCRLGGSWSFRGQCDPTWNLTTTLEREITKIITAEAGQRRVDTLVRLDLALHERMMLSEFRPLAKLYAKPVPSDDEIVDSLAWMQHYGAKTRLLDWTRSPYVALHFALGSLEFGDCAVWAIDVDWLNSASHRILGGDPSLPTVASWETMSRYTNQTLLSGVDRGVIVVATPVKMNDRIAVQKGHFLCSLHTVEPFEISLFRMVVRPVPVDRPVVMKFIVGRERLGVFVSQLQRMRIDKNSLFPGKDFARSLAQDLEVWLEKCTEQLRKLIVEQIKASGRSR